MTSVPNDVVVQHMKDHYEHNLKAANYLFVAHGAGLVGCLSVLKDYSENVAYRGVGFFICLFGVGFLGAMANYISLTFARAVVLNSLVDGEDPNRPTAALLTTLHFIGLGTSIVTLVTALVMLIVRFHSL